jgi:hypothetical protein
MGDLEIDHRNCVPRTRSLAVADMMDLIGAADD